MTPYGLQYINNNSSSTVYETDGENFEYHLFYEENDTIYYQINQTAYTVNFGILTPSSHLQENQESFIFCYDSDVYYKTETIYLLIVSIQNFVKTNPIRTS